MLVAPLALAAAEADAAAVAPQAVVRPRPEPAAKPASGHGMGDGCRVAARCRQAGAGCCGRHGASSPPLHAGASDDDSHLLLHIDAKIVQLAA